MPHVNNRQTRNYWRMVNEAYEAEDKELNERDRKAFQAKVDNVRHDQKAQHIGMVERKKNITNERKAKKQVVYKPPYPPFFRPHGKNTRLIFPPRNTGVLDNVYDKDIVQSHPVPSFVPTDGHPLQGGAPSILQNPGLSALRPGSHHWLFKIRGQ